MHSRVFALSQKKGKANTFDLPEYFVPTYADYYIEAEDRSNSIEWLTGHLDCYGIEYVKTGNTITFRKVDGYLNAMYEQFRKALNDLEAVTPEQFNKGLFSLYALKSATDDESGFWFLTEDEYPVTMQSFMRSVELNVPYYLGKVYDYHF